MCVRNFIAAMVAAAAVAGLASGSASAESVTFVKDAPLRSEARFDSAPVAQVTKGTVGDASAKQGGWLSVKTANGAGWVLTTDISFPSSGATSSSSGSSPFGNLFGRSQPTRTTSTVGIRGFDKDTIGTAFNESTAISSAQLKLLDDYAVDKSGGQSYASAKGLTASTIQYRD